MSELQVRTRGNSSPQGKPRVYFSCHPENFDFCFELLAGEILQSQNCAIWYETDWDSDLDETQLSQMQLFLVPITTKYLTQPSRARSLEYGFAIRHHIPLLPIMMEEGLETVFAEVMNREGKGFGDLQFLNRAGRDETAIPYAERLEKRLSAILTSDETAERVRAAFDAYIFLSYRKKDRAAAQRLMRLIHQIPHCRDIAIWYDEFLVPGERWAKTIAEAMERSRLVTFAVTPQVTEPGNYVMEHEFPEAMGSGKPIVPAEVEATDRAVLERLFPGLPELVDGKSQAELEQALRQIALEENDHDPMHNYLIGLAYLGAIDVERNPERAVELIQGAAEAGLTEAISKLVEMYRTGEGVDRDYSAAVDWQKRLVELRRQEFQRERSEISADRLFDALWDLLDCLKAQARQTEQWETGQEMLQIAAHTDEARRNQNLSISYYELGGIAWAREEFSEARGYCEESLAIRKALAEETGRAEERHALIANYDILGRIAEAEGDLSRAAAYYKEELTLSKEAAEETGTAEARRDLSFSYSRLGNAALSEGRLSEAADCYEESLAIRKALSEETGTVEAYRDLVVSYHKLGRIAEEEGRLSEAAAYYEKVLWLGKALSEKTGTVDNRRVLSVAYSKLGNIAQAEGRLSEAKSYYEQDLALSKALSEETGTVEARRDLSVSYRQLGDIAQAGGHLSEAAFYYEQALPIFKELAEETGTAEACRNLSVSYGTLGNIARVRRRISEAVFYYGQALPLFKELAEKTGTVRAYEDLGILYGNLFQLAAPDTKEKQEYLSQAIRIYQMLAEACPQAGKYHSMLEMLKMENDGK